MHSSQISANGLQSIKCKSHQSFFQQLQVPINTKAFMDPQLTKNSIKGSIHLGYSAIHLGLINNHLGLHPEPSSISVLASSISAQSSIISVYTQNLHPSRIEPNSSRIGLAPSRFYCRPSSQLTFLLLHNTDLSVGGSTKGKPPLEPFRRVFIYFRLR